MKIAFLVHHFSVRGSEVAIFDYAFYNKVLLHNESIIVVPEGYQHRTHYTGEAIHCPEVEKKFRKEFQVFTYSSMSNLDQVLERLGCDRLYILKSGENDGMCSTVIPTITHCIFTCTPEHSHGAVYGAISPDVAMIGAPVVPHICNPLPEMETDLRELMKIPKGATVFGRYGGKETFDISFVHSVIKRIVQERDDIYFIFMNTERFHVHPQIHYVSSTSNLLAKAEFVNTCDAMIYAREQGESFGLAIAEFTSLGKPIVAWKHDGPPHAHENQNHLNVLGDSGTYYSNEEDLYHLLNNFREVQKTPVDYSKLYTPRKVMDLFRDKFLSETQDDRVKIMVLCNFSSTKEVHKKWSKLIGNYPLRFVSSNPDYWVIINQPPDGAQYDPARTIVMGMEPDTFTGERWQWYDNKDKFLYFLDENYLNNWEWWLSKDQTQLLDYTPQKTKGNIVSAVVSSQHCYEGHKLRIAFLKEAEKEIPFDIYGWNNHFSLSSYRGKLPDSKDDGLFPYKYTFAAENTSRPNYCTEKLVDAILAECLCFYWGCPNVPEFLDEKCYIALDLKDIPGSIQVVKDAITGHEWEKRCNAIVAMKKRILTRYSFVPRLLGLIELEKLDKKTVNLDCRPDKWTEHLEQCRKAQVPNVTRFSAIRGDAYDMNSEYIKNLFMFTQNFIGAGKNTNGIVGCALSHWTLWQEVVANNRPMLVMEDDVTFQPRFVDRMGWLLNELKTTPEWELIFVGFHNHEDNCDKNGLKRTFLTDTFGPHDMVSYKYMIRYGSPEDASGLHGGGTFGYLISPRGAQKLVQMVKRCKFYFPVDYQMLECGLHYGLDLSVCPHQLLTSPKFGLDTDVSDIQAKPTPN